MSTSTKPGSAGLRSCVECSLTGPGRQRPSARSRQSFRRRIPTLKPKPVSRPELKRRVVELERQSHVLSAGLAPVQPWMDIPQLGSSVLVTTDNDREAAREACASIAEEFWRRRREYMPDLLEPREAVRLAHQASGLAVLSDAADATTSGAPGDSVWILAELLKYNWPRAALVTVVAPDVVEQCTAVATGGEVAGGEVTVRLGGVRDHRFGTTLELAGCRRAAL